MKYALLLACSAALWAQTEPSPTGNRTTPPIVNSVTPLGVARGATVEMNVEGLNLASASAVYFSEPGITAKIVRIKELPDLPDIRLGSNGTPSTVDLGPLPPRNQVTLELDISPDAPIGPVSLRLLTPLGSSPAARFLVEPYFGESPDREPNDTPEESLETYLPTVLVGAIARPGDADHYKIAAKAGEQVVFENAGAALGSALRPVVSIYDDKLALLKQFDGGEDVFAYRFENAGQYLIRIADYQESGSARHFYRIKAGKLPVAISAFPLGLQAGKTAEIALRGYNVPAQLAVKGAPSEADEHAAVLRPNTYNELKLALGSDPEIAAAEANTAIGTAQPLPLPVTVNGRIAGPDQYFRFRAAKGEKVVIEVAAARLGSHLDSAVEVLDAQGKPIERATIRCVLETSTTLSERDSVQAGIRLNSPAGFAAGDYVMIGGEIIQVEAMPRTPDDDFRFVNFNGQRLTFLDTTSEAHAVDKPVYKVQIHPAGARFAPNGLPVAHLTYRNDDGGPGYGKDSLLRFTAPAAGDYIVKLRDVRGQGGEEYAYRLTLRAPRPDFRLSASPENPNVPAGGRIPLTVTAFRIDDFDGPVEVAVEGLPRGLSATTAVIAPGQVSTILLVSAEEGASLKDAVPLRIVGRTHVQGRLIAHAADPEDKLKLISLAPRPDIQMTAQTKEVTLEPGGTAEVKVAIQRNNEFGGRVPVEVRNLPPGVRVLDVGLNGVLINEDENERSFVLEALPNAEPIEQPIIVAGRVETRSPQQTLYAAEPVRLKVKPRTQLSAR
jgi:hypothetical protein